MSTLYRNQVYEKPILTIIYQPWDKISKQNLSRWKKHKSWAIDVQVSSCLDCLDIIKKFEVDKYPYALITDIYDNTKSIEFEKPWEITSIEIKMIE